MDDIEILGRFYWFAIVGRAMNDELAKKPQGACRSNSDTSSPSFHLKTRLP